MPRSNATESYSIGAPTLRADTALRPFPEHPGRGATYSHPAGFASSHEAGQLAAASAAAPSFDWKRHFHEKHMAAMARMNALPRQNIVVIPFPKKPRIPAKFVYFTPPGPHLSDRARIVYPNPIGPHATWRAKGIIEAVASNYGVTYGDILGYSRRVKVVLARQECFWRLSRQSGLSFPKIGRRMLRDHTTVLHGVRRHQRRIDSGEATP